MSLPSPNRPLPLPPKLVLLLLLVLVLLLLLPPTPRPLLAAPPSPLPNILWIVCEDMSPDLGCYGDAYSISPNIDALAAEGIRYTRCFTHAGVCAPSRSGIITGMYPTSIGSHHMRSSAVPPPYVKCFPEYLRAAGYFCTNNAKTDYNFFSNPSDSPLTAWDECDKHAHWRHRPAGTPFFSVFNIETTHESQVRAAPAAFVAQTKSLKPEERHDPAKGVLPPYYPDTPEVRADWARYYDLITEMDRRVGAILKELEEDGLADSTIVFFYSDHGRGLPRGKRWVYDSGIWTPLIIRWPEGVPGRRFNPGATNGELVAFLDFAPTVLSLAGVEIPGHFQGRVFLGPKADPEPECIFAARDRMDETYDIIRAVRDKRFKYIRNFEPEKPYAQPIAYMDQMPTMQVWRRLAAEGKLTGPQALFFAPHKPTEELYDIERDPHEISNLAGLPEHRETLGRMRARLEKWMKETGDMGLIPEKEMLEKMRPGGVWAKTANPVIMGQGGSLLGTVEVSISCPTEGASIAYTLESGEKPHWRLYSRPVMLDKETPSIRAKACRLGYKDSEESVAEFKFPNPVK